jgi:hypothetical protein
MSNYGQSVQDYIRACEALLKTEEFTEAELEAIEQMVDRLSEKILDDGTP